MAEAVSAGSMRTNPLVLASIAAGFIYPLLWNAGLPEPAMIALKGTGVGLLAVAAAKMARSTDGRLLAAVMALGATADILLEISFLTGVAVFALGHVAAIALYLRNPRAKGELTPSQIGLAVALVLFGLAMPALMLRGDPQTLGFTAYSFLLTLMAAAAWISRFPRYRTGLGAVLFVLSDTLIAARMGPLAGSEAIGYAIWLLYYVGQLLIFLGVSRTLANR